MRLQLSSRTVTTTSRAIEDIEDHTRALKTEVSCMTNTIKNPVYRYAIHRGSAETVKKIKEISIAPVDGLHSISKAQKPTRYMINQSSSTVDYLFGTMHIKTKTSKVADTKTDQYEHQSSFTIRPAAWLINVGLNYGLHVSMIKSSLQGWKQVIEPFRPVPDDSLIFEFCREGNLEGVRSLLSRGDASVKDTDSLGQTALYVSPLREEHCGSTMSIPKDSSLTLAEVRCAEPFPAAL